jgi:membrane fusion protein (multidrug efflux system)
MNTSTAEAVPTFRPAHLLRSRTTKRIALGLAAALLATAAVAAAGRWWSVGRFIEETDDAYVGGDVTVIAPKVQGFIATLNVQDNQAVHAGDVLATLDDRDFRAAKARAEAVVLGQQALLQNLAATRELQYSVIAQARAGIGSADAEWERARQDRDRYGSLVGSAAISRQSFERADATLKQAAASQQQTRASLQAAQRQLEVIATQEMQAHAALAAATAELQAAELNLGYTVLRAPIDGVVGNRSARVGGYATTGARLLSLIPARGLWVDANFKESQLAHIRPGDPATVVADILPGRVLRGHVQSLAPATGSQFSLLPTENATGNFTKIVQRVPVRIVLDAEDAASVPLLPGLSVTAEVDTRHAARDARLARR